MTERVAHLVDHVCPDVPVPAVGPEPAPENPAPVGVALRRVHSRRAPAVARGEPPTARLGRSHEYAALHHPVRDVPGAACLRTSSTTGTRARSIKIAASGMVAVYANALKPTAPSTPPAKNAPRSRSSVRSRSRSASTRAHLRTGHLRDDGVLQPHREKGSGVRRACHECEPRAEMKVRRLRASQPRQPSRIVHRHPVPRLSVSRASGRRRINGTDEPARLGTLGPNARCGLSSWQPP